MSLGSEARAPRYLALSASIASRAARRSVSSSASVSLARVAEVGQQREAQVRVAVREEADLQRFGEVVARR